MTRPTLQDVADQGRRTIFVTHATPQDNDFALWLSAKLATAGYKVWVDRNRLRGGDDFWDEIDQVLREQSIKQIVVFTQHIRKPGVKKELAIGSAVGAKLGDPKFMVPVRADDVSFSDAPPEFIRGNILNAHPNWHDCLEDLLLALAEAGVPRSADPDAGVLARIVEARESGRRFVAERPEALLTNWFPISPPARVRYYAFDCAQDDMKRWLKDCRVPHVPFGRLAGTFADPAGFAMSSGFDVQLKTAYDVPFGAFREGHELGPFLDKRDAFRGLVNLLRQQFGVIAKARGLLPVEFASRETGWFFPAGLADAQRVTFLAPDGRRVSRALSGKFGPLHWHLCLLAKPRLWPELVYRVHATIVLSKDGRTPLPGEQTHKRRRRCTKSWWNDVWRDRILTGVRFLAGGEPQVALAAGHERFSFAAWPMESTIPVSYDVEDAPLPTEEAPDGTFVENPEFPDAIPGDDEDDIDIDPGEKEEGRP
jgi:hypothetical protein